MAEPGSPSRIALVADDDALIRRVVGMALESDGWSVLEAGDAVAAIEKLKRHDVALCIMDRRMPGPSLERRLEILVRTRPRAAIVVLSGDGNESPPGEVVHLSKPVDLEDLRRGVVRALAAIHPRPGMTNR